MAPVPVLHRQHTGHRRFRRRAGAGRGCGWFDTPRPRSAGSRSYNGRGAKICRRSKRHRRPVLMGRVFQQFDAAGADLTLELVATGPWRLFHSPCRAFLLRRV
jgi:hypothetical protein